MSTKHWLLPSLSVIAFGLWSCGGSSGVSSSQPKSGSLVSYPLGNSTTLLGKLLPNGAMLGYATPVTPQADYTCYYTPSFTTPIANWPTLTPLAGDAGTGAGDIGTNNSGNIVVGDSVTSATVNNPNGPFQGSPVYWTTPTNPTKLSMGTAASGKASSINASGAIAGTLDGNIVTWSSISASPTAVAALPKAGLVIRLNYRPFRINYSTDRLSLGKLESHNLPHRRSVSNPRRERFGSGRWLFLRGRIQLLQILSSLFLARR